MTPLVEMPRKRLEDELREVWEEWSAPPDYGLWHEHKQPTPIEKAGEALGLKPQEETPPEPATDLAENIPQTPAPAPAKHSAASSPSSPAFKKLRNRLTAQKVLEIHKQSSAVGGGGAPTPNKAAPKGRPNLSKEQKLHIINKGLVRQKPSQEQGDIIEVHNGENHPTIRGFISKGYTREELPTRYKTDSNPTGYPMFRYFSSTTGHSHYFYYDKAGSLRNINGSRLDRALGQKGSLV